MANTLQQIKDEYANEQGRDSWDEFFSWNELTHTGIDRMQYHHDQIAIRYAQEQNKELVEMLTECASVLRWTLDNAKPYSDWTTFTNSITNAMVASEELVKSSTQI